MIMIRAIKLFMDAFLNYDRRIEESYYAGAVDHADLERRMKEVQLGKAPWQKRYYI